MRFCVNFYCSAGKLSYEILQANFPGSMPCPRTIQTKLSKYDLSVPEGVINVKFLMEFLIKNNLPLIHW